MYEAASGHFELLQQPEVCMFTGAFVSPRLQDKSSTAVLNTDGVARRVALDIERTSRQVPGGIEVTPAVV